jgi:hypothetical protein
LNIYKIELLFIFFRHLEEDSVFSRCLVRRVALQTSGTPGAGRRRPQRKRMKTTRAMESIPQKEDMDWEEENDNEKMPRNHKNRTIRVAVIADEASDETRDPEQATDQDF